MDHALPHRNRGPNRWLRVRRVIVAGLRHAWSRPRRLGAVGILAACALAAAAAPARAEVSANDGFGADGSYKWHFELAPYMWVPATSAHVELGNGASASVNAGMPTVSQLQKGLTGAFMGAGLVRYGPWSMQINIDYIAASQTKSLPPGPLNLVGRSLNVNTSLVRVAPGFGYEVYRGPVASIPTTVDAQLGFAYFTDSTTLRLSRFAPDGRQLFVTSVDASTSFVQPWMGFRASIYPWPRWRFQLTSMVSGFGVAGGSWGWGAGVNASWAATKWVNLIAGFNALGSGGRGGSGDVVRSVRFIEYGPVLGVSFTF